MTKPDYTGNRDSAYSTWHRKTLPSKHTVIDNDILDLTDAFVYTLYYNWDNEGDLIPQVLLETKGILKDDNDLYILPDLTKYKQQLLALRGTAKGSNIPAFLVFYYIKDITFFTIVPLNKLAKKYFKNNRYLTITEKQYLSLISKVTGMRFYNSGTEADLSSLRFKDTLFKQSLEILDLK